MIQTNNGESGRAAFSRTHLANDTFAILASLWDLIFSSATSGMSSETDVQKIARLSGTLKKIQTKTALAQDELDVWTELAYFLCPDRLNNSSKWWGGLSM